MRLKYYTVRDWETLILPYPHPCDNAMAGRGGDIPGLISATLL